MMKTNPFHWDCERDGCFNKKKRLKLDIFGDCFPGNIQMGDVDGIVEIGGRILMLEWKESERIKTGQRIMYQMITRYSPCHVIIVVGDAEKMLVEKYGCVPPNQEPMEPWIPWAGGPTNQGI